jgi:hypothetical protein
VRTELKRHQRAKRRDLRTRAPPGEEACGILVASQTCRDGS